MRMSDIPFGTTDWTAVEPTTHKGEVGVATWRTQQFGDIRVRMVEYSPGYVSDHWCEKGTSSSASTASCAPTSRTAAPSR
jgi:hypothetical protein